jgi:hypothetical protein
MVQRRRSADERSFFVAASQRPERAPDRGADLAPNAVAKHFAVDAARQVRGVHGIERVRNARNVVRRHRQQR